MSNTHIHMSENNYFTSSRARGLFLSKVMMGTASYAGDRQCVLKKTRMWKKLMSFRAHSNC